MHLDYDRGTVARQCPEAKTLRGEVAAEIGHDPFTEAGPWQMRVAITRRKNGAFVATADLLDSDGATASSMGEMVSPDCRSLVLKALAVWISWELTDPPLPPPSLPAAPPPPPPPPPPPKRPTTDPFLVMIGLGSTVGFGAAPRPAAGVTADVGFRWKVDAAPLEGVWLTLGVRWDPPASGPLLQEFNGARIVSSRFVGTVAPCGSWWKIYGCALGELGRFNLDAEGLPPGGGGSHFYAAIGGRIGIEVPFAAHLGFRVSGEVLGTLTRVQLPINKRPAWTAPLASASVGAGLYVFF